MVVTVISGGILFADNPIVPNVGMADPHIHIFDDKAYLYATHDYSPKNTGFTTYDWWVWSSSDLIHWQYACTLNPDDTYVGPMSACWATDAAMRNGYTYWYLSVGNTVAVVRGDSPRGPWYDVLGKPLVTGGYDPATFVEDTGEVYLVYGIWGFKIAKLNDDMISLAQEPRDITITDPEGPFGPGLTDDKPDLHKHKDTYYLSWGSYYATSKNLYGPYACQGSFIDPDLVAGPFREKIESLWGNLNYDRHGKFFEWNGQWYYVCNDQSQSHATAAFRDTIITYVFYRDNGEIAPIVIDKYGVSRIDSRKKTLIAALRNDDDPGATETIIKEFSRQDERTQSLLLYALAHRGDKAALPTIANAAKSSSKRVQVAALYGLAELGDNATVALLAQLIADAQDDEIRQTAAQSLKRMAGDRINAAIVTEVGRSSAAVRAVLIRSLRDREAYECMTTMLNAARDENVEVCLTAMNALCHLAKAEYLPEFVKLLTEVKREILRREAERTVLAAAEKFSNSENPVNQLLKAVKQDHETAVEASLIRVMGMIGHDAALTTLYRYIEDENPEIREAAIVALGGWPRGTPARVLASLAADKSATRGERILALQGFINLIPRQARSSDDQLIADFEKAIGLAARLQEKRLILSQLALFRNEGALSLAQQLAEETALKPDVEIAIKKIQTRLSHTGRATASHHSANAENAIDGDPETRWSSGAAMTGGEWFQIELDFEQIVTGMVMECKGSDMDYARSYEVYVSMNSFGQGNLVAKGNGKDAVTEISFDKPVSGRTLRVVQTGKSGGHYWTICKLILKTR
jgi:arabinoxylan arabinofuranohydrolase